MTDFTQSSRLWCCACTRKRAFGKPIVSAIALEQSLGVDCVMLDDGIDPLIELAPKFRFIEAATLGPNSLIIEGGQFSPIQMRGDSFEHRPHYITVRTSHNSEYGYERNFVTALSNVEESVSRPPAMHVFDDSGRLVFRVDMISLQDVQIIAESCPNFNHWKEPDGHIKNETIQKNITDNIIDLAPYIKAHHNWSEKSIEEHLDSIIPTGGIGRETILKRLPYNQAWKVEPQILEEFVRILSAQQINFMRAFIQPTILQANTGIVSSIHVEDNIMFIYSHNALAVMDLLAIEDMWIVQYGKPEEKKLGLEIYDKDRRCIAIFLAAPDQPANISMDWCGLLHSLPSKK